MVAAVRLLPDEDARTCLLFVPPPGVNKNAHYKQLAWLAGGGEEGVVKIAFSGVRQHQDCVYRHLAFTCGARKTPRQVQAAQRWSNCRQKVQGEDLGNTDLHTAPFCGFESWVEVRVD